MKPQASDLYAGDLFGEMYQVESAVTRPTLAAYLPGLAICSTVALAAGWLADHYGFPLILLGLLLGLALSFVSEDARSNPGLDFASRHALRLGIVLLGLQVTVLQIADLGWLPFVGLIVVMAGAFCAAVFAARSIGEGREAGILAGGATAICGASAALALYGIIGQDRLSQTRFSIALVGVALASAIAMTLFPMIARTLGFDDGQAGFLIGASVHDVAQAIGGGFSFSDQAGQDATIIKLTRVALLAPIVALVAWWIGSREKPAVGGAGWRRIALPWFIIGFLILVGANSALDVPPEAKEWGLIASKSLLLLAVIAAAMRSRMALIIEAGWRPLIPVIAATLVSFVLSIGFASIFLS